MQKLISAKDIEIAVEQGKKIIYITPTTIVTPLAEDMAKINGIEISIKEICYEPSSLEKDMDMNMVYQVFKTLMDKGLLSEMMELIGGKPYEFEHDPGGLKLIRGNTVQLKKLDNQVSYRQLISNQDSTINNGIFNINEAEYAWDTDSEEVYYIIDGDITISINGNIFTGYPGDILYIPKGSKIRMSSANKAKLFYTTYLE